MNDAHGMRMDAAPVWAQGVDARAEFIAKTYLHLMGAILAFVAIEIAIFSSGAAESISRTMLSLPGGWLVVLGGFMVVSWIASRAAHTAQSRGVQYAALAGFVLAEAIIFVPLLYMANRYYDGVITAAGVATMIGFSGLTAIAFVTRKDFSFLRSVLMWGGLCAVLAIGFALVTGFTLGPIFSVAMICFAGAAILHDTSNVLHHYPADRYVGASMELFASVALLFWYVLRIFMSRD